MSISKLSSSFYFFKCPFVIATRDNKTLALHSQLCHSSTIISTLYNDSGLKATAKPGVQCISFIEQLTQKPEIRIRDFFNRISQGKLYPMAALENDYEKVRKSQIIIVRRIFKNRKSGDFSVTLSITKIDRRLTRIPLLSNDFDAFTDASS